MSPPMVITVAFPAEKEKQNVKVSKQSLRDRCSYEF
jgi:hypothetical protein